MPNTKPDPAANEEDTLREDEPIPTASDDKVIEETARLLREGRQQRETDPREPKTGAE